MSDGCRGTVLAVDDEKTVRRLYERALGGSGFRVLSVGSGAEALRVLDRRPVDAMVSDISMPGMSGTDLLGEVRVRNRDLPVVLVTGWPRVGSAVEAVEHHAYRYLSKPVSPTHLVEVIEEAVRSYRLVRIEREALSLMAGSDVYDRSPDELEASLERALASMRLVHQPIVRWSARAPIGWEALLRSDEPTLGPPPLVLEAAQRLGRLHDVGRRVRELAASSVEELPDGTSLFVNLHPLDLTDPELVEPERPLSRVAGRVVLEVTEQGRLDAVPDLEAHVAELRAVGYRVALDDLGAGYAGFGSFMRIGPEVVKVDRALVQDVHRSSSKTRLIRSLIDLCADADVGMVVEGVEVAEERRHLVELGCDLLQGYLFARPGPGLPAIQAAA